MTNPIQTSASRANERGIALVLSLFLMMAMSMVAASMMFMSQTETYGTMNYRMMSQARYGAESGVHKAANYLLSDGYALLKPGTAGDPLTNYNLTVSPVTYNGLPVVLSTVSSQAQNYPVAAVKTAFTTAGQGTLNAGLTTIQYTAYATLTAMQLTENNEVIQRWDITAIGAIGGGRPATEEVRATLETQIVPNHGYSAFATASGCGAITFQGGAVTDSYDSTAYTGNGSTPPTTIAANGDVGTNGNLKEGGTGTTLYGKLYTPRSGVGTCSSGGITALTQSGGATVTGGLVELPQQWTPPTPTIITPSPLPPTTNLSISSTTTCANLASVLSGGATCTGTAPNLTINPNGATISWGNLSVSNGANVTFLPGTYNLNSLAVSQTGTKLTIGNGTTAGPITMTLVGTDASRTVDISSSGTLAVPAAAKGVNTFVMNVVTSNQSNNTPVNVTGGGVFENKTYDPQVFVINYAGTNASTVSGGGAAAFVLNAPNADLDLTGGSNFYGSMIVKTLKNTGGTSLHYDKNLANFYGIAGNPLLSEFSWKRF